MIQEVRILVLDLIPTPELGVQLQGILQRCSNPILHVRREFTSAQRLCDPANKDLVAGIKEFSPDVIFLMLSSKELKAGLSPSQALIGKAFDAPVIAVFNGNKSDQMVGLFKVGFADFVTPPLKGIDILPRIWRLIEHDSNGHEIARTFRDRNHLGKLKGKCQSFREEVEKIPIVASYSTCVLISGETGTGKELFARAIHYLSPRASRPFVPVSCGTIPSELVENELFGHIRGAYTGADTSQRGLIQEAEGGTLFLDEVDCLPPHAQQKLLRVIQEKEYRQLGCTKIRLADVRIVAATNIDLQGAVEGGKFRQDLYYRLNVVPLSIPPLRERRSDIPLLARHFLAHFAHQCNREIKGFSPDAVQKMLSYDWPGNVRELENVVERTVVFAVRQIVQDSDIVLPRSAENALLMESFREAKHRFVRTYIEKLLISHKGNISQAARAADKDRRAFFELMRKYRIEAKSFRSDCS